MGLIERFGRIADTYVSEKEQLLGAEEERRGTGGGEENDEEEDAGRRARAHGHGSSAEPT